ncbi:hypothetical protein J2T17_003284 [Paenibacillus mucilaginosus]|uniref:hypothetical protein n=1 Tax=Paenibacillus mucilaginosus TaxID=61624 RepID=UPI003D1E9BE0
MKIEEQVKVFQCCHDGTLVRLEADPLNKDILWVIECEYIVEMMEPGTSELRGCFRGCTELYFQEWGSERKMEKLEELAALELEVYAASERDGAVIVACYLTPDTYASPSQGGELVIRTRDLALWTQTFRSITAEELLGASAAYWQDFARKSSET